MPVLFMISKILKSGGEIYRHENGSLGLRNSEKVHEDILNATKPIFSKIDSYYQSVEGMGKSDLTIWKMIFYICGWQQNAMIKDFLLTDEVALNLFFDYQAKLDSNGWKSIYDDYRQFETTESDELKKKIIQRVVLFGKGVKQKREG